MAETASHKAVLDNGAVVLAEYVPGSPVVTIQVRVLSGLSNEGAYAGSGISHFLEHLLFKGTAEMNAGEVSDSIREMGGVVNGFTGLDSAGYYITVPNDNFEKAVSLITNIVMDPVFSNDDLEKEREVILKEIKMHKDDPESDLIRRLFSAAYMSNVYRYPVIGYAERFKELTAGDVRAYHAGAYTPDRVVIAIAGGVSPARAVEGAEKAINKYSRSERWIVPESEEPRQLSARTEKAYSDVNMGYIAIGFHGPDLFSEDMFAMDVLSVLLGRGRDSRLYQRLVREKELLYGISCSNITPKYTGLFIVTGTGEPGKLEAAREEILNVINEVRAAGVLDSEVERSGNIVAAEYIRSCEDTGSMASMMADSRLLTGDERFYEKYVEEIKAVDVKDVSDAAKKYLRKDNSTEVVIMPGEYRVLDEAAAEGADVRDTVSERVNTLGNGLKVIVKEDHRLPVVSAVIVFPGGLRAEDQNNNGISTLTSSLLLKGTRKRGEEDIVPVLERTGGSITSFSGWNSMGVSVNVLSSDADKAFDILSDVVMEPVFSSEEIRRQKEKIVAVIKEQEKDIFEKGELSLKKMLYGDHPYAMRPEGDINSLENIGRDDIRRFYKKHFAPDGAVLVIVGDIDTEKATRQISDRFGAWRGRIDEISDVRIEPLAGSVEKDLVMDKEQSLVLTGFQGVSVLDEQKYALSVIGSMMSGGGGLLFETVREEKGLAYSCGALNRIAVEPGYFIMYAATAEDNVEDVKRSIFDVVKSVREGNMPGKDITSAKNRILTSYAAALQTGSSLAMVMALDELYGMGVGYYREYPELIKNVTKEDIIACADELLDPERCAVVTVHAKEGGEV